MSSNIIKVQLANDHMDKVKQSPPDKALCELIWNAFDADATNVNITFPPSGLLPENKKVVINDNGRGIDWNKRQKLFGTLGGSWKKNINTTLEGRRLHGSEGQGRFKGYSLGRVVEWSSCYEESDELFSFEISGRADKPTDFAFDNHQKKGIKTGVSIEINELVKQFQFLDDPAALVEKIAPVFSLYLKSYPNVELYIEGISVDPSSFISEEVDIPLDDIVFEGEKYPLNLKLVEWNEQINKKEIWFCSKDSVPLQEYDRQIRNIGNYSFSAYLSSGLFRELNHQNLLSLSGLSSEVNKVVEEAIQTLKHHFRMRKVEDHRLLFEGWKKEGVYPYSSDELLNIQSGKAPVKKAEQELFEILALTVREALPNFDQDPTKTKKYQLHMLKQALESGDSTLKRIFKEVLELPQRKQDELVNLLEVSSLSNVIKVSNEISERIKFVSALEEMIYDKDIARNVKERSQLHKILAENTWIFGEEFTLTINDQSLTKVLEQHLKNKSIGEIVVDKPVKRVDGKNGIVDLMLTRSIGHSVPDELSYLVVELKRPTKHIGQAEYRQVEDYASAIINDPRFHGSRSKWEFWIIGDDYSKDNFVRSKIKDSRTGTVESNTFQNITYSIKAVTWSMLFNQVKHRLEFLQNHLNINASKEDSLAFLREKYAEYTDAVEVDVTEKAS